MKNVFLRKTAQILFFIALLCAALAPEALASNVVDSGTCGPKGYENDVAWTLTDDGTLLVCGNRDLMRSTSSISPESDYPWFKYRQQIEMITVDGNVSSISSGMASGEGGSSLNPVKYYGNLKKVLLCSGVESIYSSFRYSPIREIFLPHSVTLITDSTMKNNPYLSDIYYEGSEDDFYAIRTSNSSTITTVANAQFWDNNVYPTIHYNSRYVRYMDNGGNYAPYFQGFELGTTTGLLLTSQTPTREGYVFTEWNTEPDGSGTSYLPGQRYQFDDSVVLYAQWFGDGPTADVAESTVPVGTEVRLSCPTKGDTIYYTTDGRTPTASSARYTGPITIDRTMTLKAVAIWNGTASQVSTYDYQIYDVDKPLIRAGKARTVAGNKAVVPIYLENNPGIASLRVSIAYDDTAMTLESAVDGGLLSGTNFQTDDLTQDPFYLYWDNYAATENDTESGLIATLTFSAYKDTKPGYYPVTLTLSEGDAMDCDMHAVPFSPVSALIHVDAAYLGDVDSNDKLEAADGMRLMRYLANWKGYDTGIDLLAADINRDLSVDMLDGAILLRHLAKWSNYKILPCTPSGASLHSFSLASAPILSVSSGSAMAGETIDVTIDISNNPGVAMMRLYVDYDSDILTLTKVTDGRLLGSAMHGVGDNLSNCPYTLFWNNATARSNFGSDGTIATLTFRVNESLDEKKTLPITLSYSSKGRDIMNIDLEPVEFDLQAGSLAVGPLTGETEWGSLSYTYDKSAGTVVFYGKVPSGAAVYCAQYNAFGKMLGVASISVGKVHKVPEDVASVRLFLLDAAMKPLTISAGA